MPEKERPFPLRRAARTLGETAVDTIRGLCIEAGPAPRWASRLSRGCWQRFLRLDPTDPISGPNREGSFCRRATPRPLCGC